MMKKFLIILTVVFAFSSTSAFGEEQNDPFIICKSISANALCITSATVLKENMAPLIAESVCEKLMNPLSLAMSFFDFDEIRGVADYWYYRDGTAIFYIVIVTVQSEDSQQKLETALRKHIEWAFAADGESEKKEESPPADKQKVKI